MEIRSNPPIYYRSKGEHHTVPALIIPSFEIVAQRRSASLHSGFGLGHVREYAPSALGGALVPCVHLALILRPCISSFVQSLSTFASNVREWHFVQHSHLYDPG